MRVRRGSVERRGDGAEPGAKENPLEDRDEGLLALCAVPSELIAEVEDLLWLCRDLAGQDHVALLITERDGQLSGVLVDPEKEHAAVLLFRDWGKVPHWGIPNPLAIALSSISKDDSQLQKASFRLRNRREKLTTADETIIIHSRQQPLTIHRQHIATYFQKSPYAASQLLSAVARRPRILPCEQPPLRGPF
jgi:hypothetical protein